MTLSKTIGVAGTGKMGSAIVRRLLSCGQKVHIWNRTQERAQPLLDAGAIWVAKPRELALQCDIVISIVTDEAALDSVYGGSKGLLVGAKPGQIFIDMSTVSPSKPAEIGVAIKTTGAMFLECPVGGSVGPASEGKLIGFVGGDTACLEAARETLQLLCRRIEHIGALGAGATMKLAINLPLMVYWQTLAESLSLMQPLGLDPQRIVDILSETSGGPNMLKTRGPMISKALNGTSDGSVSVDLNTMRKDLKAMLQQATAGNYRLPLTAQTLLSIEQASADGLSQSDCTQLPVWWLQNGGKI